jgi:hypothetical protein
MKKCSTLVSDTLLALGDVSLKLDDDTFLEREALDAGGVALGPLSVGDTIGCFIAVNALNERPSSL